MPDDPFEALKRWSQAQQAFWAQAMHSPAAQAIADFAPSDWQMADDLLDHLLAGFQPEGAAQQNDWIALLQAGQAYKKLIHATWANVQRDFEAHRIAVTSHTSNLPDWTELRDRWLAIAEAAFVRLMRSPAFVSAQRDLLAAWCNWYSAQDSGVREAVQAARLAQKTAATTAMNLVRVPIAETPKQQVWRGGKASVHRYLPLRPGGAELGPILICYGLVGRQTMTDLLPQRSLVRNLLAMGVDVFVIDWGSAGPEDVGNDLAYYAVDALGQCIDAVCDAAGAQKLTLMGICQGGTLALCHAALRPKHLSGLICTGAPVDFHADEMDADPAHGLLNVWMRGLSAEDADRLIDLEHGLSGDFLGAMFNQLNPVRSLGRYLVDLPGCLADPGALNTFMAMETWLADRPDLPAALARTWLKGLYQENRLVKGVLELNGESVDLSAIGVPVLNMIAANDHIIPPPCSAALSGFIAPELYRTVSIPAGHIGMFVGRQAQTVTAPGIAQWLREIA